MLFKPPILRGSLFDLFLLPLIAGGANAYADQPAPEAIDFFEKKIRPILVEQCYECHSAGSKEVGGSLLLDSRQGLLTGGDSGPAIIPADVEKSLLLIAVRHTDKDLRMPPEKKLSVEQIADLEVWVKGGAADPRTASTAPNAPKPIRGVSLEEGRKFWSFQPVVDPPLPAVQQTSWPQTGIDHFILARLEQAGAVPAPQADKRTLLRRVTFDLTGLPPTPAETASFLADDSPGAFEAVIDRLLVSPRYGERWGRHWLDVVRYADTCGNASDYPVPQAHKYRDWVIAAFNGDMPYDEFVRQQIAGDLISGGNDEDRFERIKATGYLAIARRFGGDRNGEHHLTLEDTIDNLGRSFLGSSIACARCHDHKFDPFTTSDYYGLYGIFSSTRFPFPGAEVGKKQEDFVPLLPLVAVEAALQAYRDRIAASDAEVKKLEAEEAELQKLTDSPERTAKLASAAAELAQARKKHADLQSQPPTFNDAYAVADGSPVNAKVHLRGDPKRLGEEVSRQFPAVLGGQSLPSDYPTSGRLELAQWITERTNPLTARVMVNRIWQHHFGKGLVETPNDFGRQGKPPTHPELLDYLASRFIESGWSIKAMHRLVLLSRAWQVSSQDVPQSMAVNPNDELFWRFTRRRLDAESLRDSLLFVSGSLNEKQGGAHPFPPPNTWGWTQHNPFMAVYESRQRSVYLMQQRLRRNPYLALFDGPDPSSSTGVRLPSTTPLQALFLMNGLLAHEVASSFAGRVLASGREEAPRLETAYQLAFNRSPNIDEQRQALEFVRVYREKLTTLQTPAEQLELETWSALARSLLSSNEFVFID